MNIIEAYTALSKGKKVRRKDWVRSYYLSTILEVVYLCDAKNPQHDDIFYLALDGVLGTDWEIFND